MTQPLKPNPHQDDPTHGTDETLSADSSSALSRRGFLGGFGLTAAGVATGSLAFDQLLQGAPAFGQELDAVEEAAGLTAAERRRRACHQVRVGNANHWRSLPLPDHPTNGDEERYPTRLGNYSKSLPHNEFGEVDRAAYSSFLRAIRSGDPRDYDAIILAAGARKQTSPQCGLAFDSEGPDSHAVAVPAPPALASRERAGEMIEQYWQALLRDVDFRDYDSSPIAQRAIDDLNRFGNVFKGPKENGRVTAQTLFRDIAVGTSVGPYLSQFMWLNTPFGVEFVDRRMWTYAPQVDHMQTFEDWLAVQNGRVPGRVQPLGSRRYPINGRDLSAWVHIDVLFQAYFNACLILMTPPDNTDIGGGLGVPFSQTNPYNGNDSQAGFCTFGPPAVKALLCEVSTRALKATWHKKWQVHRTLRPEVMGGRIEVQLRQSPGRYNGLFHRSLYRSPVLDEVAAYNGGSFLLPMAFPEGSPTHPSYTAGHATVAGACITILKAMFRTEGVVIERPVQPSADGLVLEPYVGPPLTVEGELNKIASNVSTGRNIAGVHWRSDAYESLRIGEAVAVGVLRDYTTLHNETFSGFDFRGFDGQRIRL